MAIATLEALSAETAQLDLVFETEKAVVEKAVVMEKGVKVQTAGTVAIETAEGGAVRAAEGAAGPATERKEQGRWCGRTRRWRLKLHRRWEGRSMACRQS